MALKATICRVGMQISDLDRQYYAHHALTVSRHPSETDMRMMLRLLAFAAYADPALGFGRGISTDDEPDLWRKSLDGRIELWIDLGQPDEKRLRKACGQADQVVIITYSGHSATLWWQQIRRYCERFSNLDVYSVSPESAAALGQLSRRSMDLQITIQDGLIWFNDAESNLELTLAGM